MVVTTRKFQCINSGVGGRVIAGAIATGAVAWFALVVFAPGLPAALAAAVYTVGSLICHQMPDRSFHWHGAQLAVCARCTGIYLGACASALLAPLPAARYARWGAPTRIAWLLGAAAVPMGVTLVAEWAGVWTPSSIVRAATGLVLGAAGAVVVLAAINYSECLPRAAAAPRPPHPRQPPTPI